MLLTQLKYDLLMFSRELFYLVFTILVPPVTYLFMGQLFGDQTYSGNLNYAETYTPSFILVITFTVVFFAFGFDQVMQRTTGVEKRISISPVSKSMLLLSSIIRAIIMTSFGFILISIIGFLLYDLEIRFWSILLSYGFFIILNAVMLILASAIYSFFQRMNSALVFSIVIFQVIIFTGGLALPIKVMPNFIQVIAKFNPLYHMNNLFIAVWNGHFTMDSQTVFSVGYLAVLVLVAFICIRIQHKRKIG